MTAFEIMLRPAAPERSDEAATPFVFQLEPGDELVFGRGDEADIRIPDTERKVSSRHGRLRCEADGSLRAFDSSSLNGTLCNGRKILPNEGVTFSNGDQLRVGEWILEVSVNSPSAGPEHADELDATICTVDIKGTSTRLADELLATYDNGLDATTEQRATQMQRQVEEALKHLKPQEAGAVLDELSVRFDIGEGAPLTTSAKTMARTAAEPAAPTPPAPAQAVDPAAADTLIALAKQLVPSKDLTSTEDMQCFADLLHQVCHSSLTWLAKGLQSRGVFAQEFGAEVTLVFQRSTNPLKTMSAEQLPEYLLDWSNTTDPATRLRYLDAVLQDLSEHQVAVLAGVKEAINGLIDRLSPERIQALAKSAPGWTRASKSWNAFCEMHAEMREEQNKLYNEMITPSIQKGYLHQHGDDTA